MCAGWWATRAHISRARFAAVMGCRPRCFASARCDTPRRSTLGVNAWVHGRDRRGRLLWASLLQWLDPRQLDAHQCAAAAGALGGDDPAVLRDDLADDRQSQP